MRRAALLLIAACGSTAVPTATPVVAVKAKTPPRMEPTCEDMGPLLKRALARDSEDGAIVETIAAECRDHHWPASVLACVADTLEVKANDCLAQLDAEQTASLDSNVGGYSAESYEDYIPEPQCADVLKATDVADWNPPVVGEEQRELARELRRPMMMALCDAQMWTQETVSCIGDGTDPGTLASCEEGMEPGLKSSVIDAVARADGARNRMTALMKKAAAGYSCEKAVAVHYAAAKWKGQVPTIGGGSRAKVIEASKKMMRDACNAEGWSADVRACVVAVDAPVCWKIGKLASDDQTWSYPAEGTVPFATGVAECDEWGAAVTRVFGCKGVPEELRVSLRTSWNSVKGSFGGLDSLPRETLQQTLPAIADSCRQARDTIAQVAQNAGC